MKTQSEIALAKVKADLDAKLSVLDAHLKAATGVGIAQPQRSYPPGAGKAKDGNYYLVDPARPGKYLQVIHHG